MLDLLASTTPPPPTPLRILVVEDESLVALDLEERLAKLGYKVVGVVDNGEEALLQAQIQRVDLILMDIHIHGSRDGVETADQVRRMTDIPVVFLTAHADEATLRRAGLTEPFGYVLKPFDERELHATIQMAHYRHRAESRLRKMERWLTTTLRSIGDGVIATDAEGRVTFINAMAEAVSGWSRREALGLELTAVFAICTPDGTNETADLLRRALQEGAVITVGEGRRLRARDGRLIPVDDSLAPIRDDDGTVIGCVIIFRDNTANLEAAKERRQLEQKMQEAQRLESLGVMASGIAHDFNNLLGAVTGNASLARAMVPDDSPLLPCLVDIEQAAERAAQLCRQMLDYAGKSQVRMLPLELSSFAHETANLLQIAIDKKTTLVFDLADGLPPLLADRSQLQQIVMNLVINGSEALQGREGQLTVRTRLLQATPAYLAACRIGADLKPGNYLLLEVRDNGQGMTPDVLARIFDPFFTTKFIGRGLGLAAVGGIVKQHHGALSVESKPGVGTSFQVLFPVAEAVVLPPPPPTSELAWRGSGRALLVDDEPAIRLVGAALLRLLGFDVETAEDGLAGKEKALEATTPFSVILLDLTMPRMNGQEAYKLIRKKYSSLPIILMSGYSPEQAASLFELGGATTFLQKPFSLANLTGKLQTMLRA